MNKRLGTSHAIAFGLSLLALGVIGLVGHLHAAAMPLPAVAAPVLPQVLDAAASPAPSPAQDGTHARRPSLSMPYFSFARLLRPGS